MLLRNRTHDSRFLATLIATAGLAAALAGCTGPKTAEGDAPYGAPTGQEAPTAAASASPAGEASPAAGEAPAGAEPAAEGGEAPGGMAPFAGMGGSPTAPLTPTPKLDEAIVSAEKGGDKKTIAVAYAERGTFRMNDDDAGARVKYRAALDDYRKALAADPANAEAKKNKQMIEDIYKSMGRPVPGEEGGAAAGGAGTAAAPPPGPAAKP